jgi:minor extracellular serine protease Vpr
MKRRLAIAGLSVVLIVGSSLPAQSEPPYTPETKSSGRFRHLDVSKLGKIINAPRSLDKTKVVDALVELDTASVVQQRSQSGLGRVSALSRVKASQKAALPKLKAAGATTYGSLTTVLNAVQVRVATGDLAKLAKVPGVKTVQVSRIIQRDNSASNKATGVGDTWQAYKHTGKGQRIGIIDTGIDYTHADFGGVGTPAAYKANDSTTIEPGSFPTAKVVAGYDFVGNDFDADSDTPANTVPKPDADPLDCYGHGTHVAGTAAGAGVTEAGATYTGTYTKATLNQTFDVEPGAAPEAKLGAYKVFGCTGTVPSSVIIAAIDRATSDNMDIINMSLGSGFGGANGLEATAVSNATEAGVLVVTSAGNDGPGSYVVGSPSSSNDSLSVAAVDTEFATFPGVTISGAANATGLVANDAEITSPITGQLVDLGLGCDEAAYTAASGKIALTTRGVCDRVARLQYGQAAGALAVIMINDAPGLPPFEGDQPGLTIPFIGVSADDGPALTAADGKSVTITANAGVPNPGYKYVAAFSSNGPRVGDSAQKPDLAAPGVSVPSAAVGSGTGAIRESGTSMASPHTAGAAALVRQAHPTWTARQVKALLMSTASPGKIKGYDSRRVGTGLVQPARASEAKTYAWTPSNLNSLRFGMNQLAGGWTETQKFKITNKTKKTVTYGLSTDLSTKRYGSDITISPRSITVKSGDTRDVRVKLHLSRSDTAKLPGASANDGTDLTSINGFVLARPRSDRAGVLPLRISFLFVPVPLSNIEASASVTQTKPGQYSPISLRNTGIHTGDADTYAWLIADPAGDAPSTEVADLTNLGVQSLPGGAAGLEDSDRLVVFAASEALGASTQSIHEVELPLDTTGDGIPDFVTFAVDTGYVLGGFPDGTLTSFTFNATSGALVDAWRAVAPTNGSTVELPVAASSLGLTDQTGPITVSALGFSAVEGGSPYPDETDEATFDPYALPVSQGDLVTLKPGQRKSLPVKVDESQFASQTHLGWLIVTLDDKAGLREADRVRLVAPAGPEVAAKAKTHR